MSALAVGVLVLLAAACSGAGTPSAGSRTASTGATTSTEVGAQPSSGCTDRARPLTSGRHAITVGTAARTYELSVPRRAGTGPAPLVLLFHGFAGSGRSITSLTGLPARAAAHGTIVVAPDGAGHTWQLDAHGTDAAFVDALLGHLVSTVCIDLHRVYAAGFSAGAAFTVLFSCARPDRIAAIATVSADFQLGCHRPMPIVAFHGTKDPAVPFVNGGVGASLPGVKVRGTELNLRDWAALDRCRPTPQTQVLGSQVTRQTWSGCAPATDVVLYRIEGGGHSWPGAAPGSGAGLTTQQISATDLILAFFADHRLVP
jgi:polyhydroxybutyrate depolymerase